MRPHLWHCLKGWLHAFHVEAPQAAAALNHVLRAMPAAAEGAEILRPLVGKLFIVLGLSDVDWEGKGRRATR